MHSLLLLIAAASIVYAEQCATPKSKEGKCVELNDCADIKALFDKPELSIDDRKYIKRSQCPGDVPKVCCQVSNKTVEYKLPVKPEKPIVLNFRGDEDEFPLPTECGVQNFLDDKIIGVIANIDEFPWMALLKYQTEFGAGYACGGALISKLYVLTAAHCVTGRFGPPVEVTLGEYDLTTKQDCAYDFDDVGECAEPAQHIGIQEIVKHPQYAPGLGKLHDIALIRLKMPAMYTDYILPICLPDAEVQTRLLRPRMIMEVAGWGKTKELPVSNIKRKARIPIVDRNACAQIKNMPIADSQICAGGKSEDSCSGDSGGPLMAKNKGASDERWYISGIVSFGPKKCATKGVPGVYTNVASYVSWIKDNIKP